MGRGSNLRRGIRACRKALESSGVAALIVALVITGVAVAARALTSNAYTDAEGVYHACVNSTNGNVRVVVPGDACRAHEVAIDWNQTGPPGAPGLNGTNGTNGTDGTASNAYSATGPGIDQMFLPGAEATAATLSLSPGAYAITGEDSRRGRLGCRLGLRFLRLGGGRRRGGHDEQRHSGDDDRPRLPPADSGPDAHAHVHGRRDSEGEVPTDESNIHD